MPAVHTQLKPAAAAVKRSKARFRVLVAGRRFGKSRLSECELVEQALLKPGSRSVYLAPTRVQAKQILWQGLKERVPPSWIDSKNETALQLKLNNGSIIQLAGADYSDSLRGISADLIVVDEFCFVSNLEEQMAGTEADVGHHPWPDAADQHPRRRWQLQPRDLRTGQVTRHQGLGLLDLQQRGRRLDPRGGGGEPTANDGPDPVSAGILRQLRVTARRGAL